MFAAAQPDQTESPPAPKKKHTRPMKPTYEHVALLHARGAPDREIAEVMGLSPGYVWRVRNETEGFDALVTEFKREIQERLIQETVDAAAMLNRRVPTMVNNLEDIALRGDKESNRLKATQDWLDRAPDAPKRISRSEIQEDRNIVLTLRQVDNIKEALMDVGADDVLELIEGEDFSEIAPPADGPVVINADELD